MTAQYRYNCLYCGNTNECSTTPTFKSSISFRPTPARPKSTSLEAVGLAPSAVLERIRKLEARGVAPGLRGRTSTPRPSASGLLAFVAVRSDEAGSENRIASALAELPEVLEVHHVAGDDCYLIKVRARDAEHLGQLLRTRFARIPGVRSTRTTIVLETVKETSRLADRETRGGARMTPAAATRRRLAYFAWARGLLIWGTTYLGIRVSLESMPPALMGGLRWTIAGVAAHALSRRPRPAAAATRRSGAASRCSGSCMLGLGNGGVVFAEQWVPSGLAAVMVATSPFWMAAVEAFLPDGERLRRSACIAGLVDRVQRHRPAGLAGPDARDRRAVAASSPGSWRCRSLRSAGRSARRTRSARAARRRAASKRTSRRDGRSARRRPRFRCSPAA